MIRTTLLRILATSCLLAGLATTGTAQVSRIPNTGCPNAAYPSPSGSPALGQGFGVSAAACQSRAGQPFIVLGVPGLNAVLPMPPACEARCVLECRPLIVLLQGSFRALIPNDRGLIGATLCFQTGCVEAQRPACLHLHGALGVTIMP